MLFSSHSSGVLTQSSLLCLQVNGKTIFSLATCIVVDFPFKFLIVVESYKFGSYQLNKILVMT